MSTFKEILLKRFGERGNPFLRSLDYLIGIPLIAFLGSCRTKAKIRPPNPKKIALLKTAGIGDTVLLGAVCQDLKKIFPAAQLSLFCGANNYEVGLMLEGIQHVVSLPITNPLAAIKTIIHAGRFDYWLDFGPWPRLNSLLTWAAQAACKVGFATSGQYRHYVYDCAVKHTYDVHELENYRSMLRTIGVEPESIPALRIPGGAANLDIPGRLPLKTPRVVFHMFPGGSRAFLKTWPVASWRELAGFFLKRGWQVVLTGGKSDWQPAQKFSLAFPKRALDDNLILNLAGCLDLHQLALVLQESTLAVSVDTGVMHMAAALGMPVIALFGPTSPWHWRPLGAQTTIMYQGLKCSPCLRLGFESRCRRNLCLDLLTPEAVIGEIYRSGLLEKGAEILRDRGPRRGNI